MMTIITTKFNKEDEDHSKKNKEEENKKEDEDQWHPEKIQTRSSKYQYILYFTKCSHESAINTDDHGTMTAKGKKHFQK